MKKATKKTTNEKAKFSRINQPVKCRVCGKKTTWSESNGEGGGDICKKCWDAAGLENEHLDGHHKSAPAAHCALCVEELKTQQEAAATTNETKKETTMKKATKKNATKKTSKIGGIIAAMESPTALSTDLEAGKILAKDSLGEVIPEQPIAAPAEESAPAKKAKAVTPAAAKKAVHALVAKIVKEKKAASAESKPAKKAAAKKKAKSDDNALRIHLYGTGKVFLFPKLAAERINGLPNMLVEIKGRKLTLTPTKSAKDTTPITAHQGRPILRAGKILKDVEWSGKTQDLVAKPIGEHAFEVELDGGAR